MANETTSQTLAADVVPIWIRNELLQIADRKSVV